MTNTFNHSIAEYALLYAGLLFLSVVVVSCVDSVPEAMHAETMNQRHSAAKAYTYQGYNKYQQFTNNN